MKLVVVGPKNLTRDGVQCLLENREVEVVGETGSGERALDMVLERQPDAVVLYLDSPDLDAVELVRALRDRCPGSGIAVVAAADSAHVARAAMTAGAHGSAATTSTTEELLAAVRAAADGEEYVAESLALPARSEDPVYTLLTPRERQVLKGIAEGSTSQEIADALGIRYKTVDSHRQNLARKLEASGIAELVKHAIRARLISVQD